MTIRFISYQKILCPQTGQLYNKWLKEWHRYCIWIHFCRLYDVCFGAFTMSHFVASKFNESFKNHKRISLKKKTHTFFCPKVTRLGHDRLQKLASHWKRICFHDDEMFPLKSRKRWMILGNNCSMFVSYYTLMFVHSSKTHLTSIENLINCHLFITWCMIGVISIVNEKFVCLSNGQNMSPWVMDKISLYRNWASNPFTYLLNGLFSRDKILLVVSSQQYFAA